MTFISLDAYVQPLILFDESYMRIGSSLKGVARPEDDSTSPSFITTLSCTWVVDESEEEDEEEEEAGEEGVEQLVEDELEEEDEVVEED